MPTSPFRLLALTCVVGAASQSTDPFVGTWKFDQSRSVLADEMSITPAGPNAYAIKFVGVNPDTIVADGQDHPSVYAGTTFSIAIEKPGIWKVVRKKDGRVLLTARWTLGPDGQTLTDAFNNRPDDTVSTIDLAYRRTPGSSGSGIPGTWESTSETVNGTFLLQIRPYETSGLSIHNAGLQTTKNVKFDGKEYRGIGPTPDSTYVSSAQWVDGRTFDLTDKLRGKVTDTQRVTVSADRKTLTITVHLLDQRQPNVFVFNRDRAS